MAELTRANYNVASKKQEEYYSDFLTDFDMHPMTKELSRNTNINAVKRSVRNLILTNRNERLFNSNIGGNISRLLFEPMGVSTADSLKHAINDTLSEHEPRIKLSNIEVLPDPDNNLYRINIYFMIVNIRDPVGMTVALTRS